MDEAMGAGQVVGGANSEAGLSQRIDATRAFRLGSDMSLSGATSDLRHTRFPVIERTCGEERPEPERTGFRLGQAPRLPCQELSRVEPATAE